MKWFKLIIVLLLCAVAILAFVAWRGTLTMRQGMADCLIWQAASLADRFSIDEENNHELVAEINEYAQRIAHGIDPVITGFEVLRSFYDGPLLLALLHTSLINRIDRIEAPEAFDRKNFSMVSLQFFLGVKSGKIADADWQKVRSLLMEQRICETESSIGFVIPEQVESFRKKISFQALSDCLALMDQASSNAPPVAEQAILDPVLELKKVLTAAR
ncbi:MAG: hypothetical protein ACD_39C00344G0002 [uncultured bacterium]|nr:MAG: hypothetical protein ACD_39C00344G0002 [uncultured bacterium]